MALDDVSAPHRRQGHPPCVGRATQPLRHSLQLRHELAERLVSPRTAPDAILADDRHPPMPAGTSRASGGPTPKVAYSSSSCAMAASGARRAPASQAPAKAVSPSWARASAMAASTVAWK